MSKDLKLCNKIPTIIAFTAKEWCHPCQLFEPTIEILKKKHDGINHHITQCDQSDDILGKYIESFSVGGFPTVMIYLPSKGKFVLYSGKRDETEIKKFIKKISESTLEELEQQFKIWENVPHESIAIVDHGDSCASL